MSEHWDGGPHVGCVWPIVLSVAFWLVIIAAVGFALGWWGR